MVKVQNHGRHIVKKYNVYHLECNIMCFFTYFKVIMNANIQALLKVYQILKINQIVCIYITGQPGGQTSWQITR